MTVVDFEIARHNMLEQQIRTWEVFDQKILGAIGSLHREDFMPDEYRDLALADTPIPLAHGQVTMTPRTEARMLQSLDLTTTDKVLEIGTGSGYVSALLAVLCGSVISLDIFEEFTTGAGARAIRHGIRNLEFICDDGVNGYAYRAPYDVIVMTGSIPEITPALREQLSEGGRLFAVVGRSPVMEATVVTRQSGNIFTTTGIFETELPPLIGVNDRPEFII